MNPNTLKNIFSSKKNIIASIIFILVSASVYFTTQDHPADQGVWYSIVPPLLAVTLAFATQKIIWSLLISVLVGGALTFSQNGIMAVTKGPQYAFNAVTNSTNIQILVFVFLVLVTINVISTSGGFQAMARSLSKYAKGRRSSQLITAIMGVLVFIDDYANTMIVGPSMRPLTDKNNVSRQKLAFLVDATSAPVAGLAVVSTWIGYEIGLFADISKSLNLGKDGYAMFFDALPFRFYCIFMIVFMFAHILIDVDFGPMRKAEALAQKNKHEVKAEELKQTSGHILTALIPLLSLLAYLLVMLWFDGKGNEKIDQYGTVFSIDYWRDVIGSSQNNILILAQASVLGLLLAIVTGKLFSNTGFTQFKFAILEGAKKSLLPITILVLAWSLKGACEDLKTGTFLASNLAQTLNPAIFPLLLFICGAIVSFSTGTSWGTMAILIPTAVPIAFALDGSQYGLITIMSLAAVLDGSIFGDHCSPISDTTIMSSMASDCNHMEHVITQMPYSLFVAAIALVFGYLPSGYGLSGGMSELLGISLMLVILIAIKKFQKPLNV